MSGARDSEMHLVSINHWSFRALFQKQKLPLNALHKDFITLLLNFNDQKHMQSALHFTVCDLLYVLFWTLLSDIFYAKFISLLNLNCV